MTRNRVVSARAPTRIDLGGGWTDVPPYCDREGGFVCNVAISRYATAHVMKMTRGIWEELAMPHRIVSVILERTGLNGLEDGLHIDLRNDFPIAAGLGGSSAASAAILGAIAGWKEEEIDRDEIAEEGRRIEVEEMGIAGGRQDHYAATFGGALGLTFTSTVSVKRLDLSDQTRRALVNRSVLIYTGASRVSGDTITAVLGAYERGEHGVVSALAGMRELAKSMAASLEGGDVDALAEMLDEHWAHQRSLHPSIPTPRIDEIIASGKKAGAIGAKAMGASGGGCVLLLAKESNVEAVCAAVGDLGQILKFDIDQQGLTLLQPS